MDGAHHSAYGGKGPTTLGVLWAQAAVATIVVGLRAYSAIYILRRAYWDLFWILLTWVSACVAQGFLTASVLYGYGNHAENLTKHDIVEARKWEDINTLIAMCAVVFGRIAVIAFLLRIQGNTRFNWRYFLHGIWIVNMLLAFSGIFLTLFECSTVQRDWDSSLPGHCKFTMFSLSGVARASVSAASDFFLATYPIIVFWSLNMSMKRKLGLCALMGGGFVTAGVAVAKAYLLSEAAHLKDIIYSYYVLQICGFTEMWLIIILYSLPQLKPVVTRVMDFTRQNCQSLTATVTEPSRFFRSRRARLEGSRNIEKEVTFRVYREGSEADILPRSLPSAITKGNSSVHASDRSSSVGEV